MKVRTVAALLALWTLGGAEPALAQNIFERLFGAPRPPGPQQPYPGPPPSPYLQPPSQPQPQFRPQAPAQPRRSPQTQPSQPRGAQPAQPPAQQQAQPPAPVVEPPPAPYENELLRLAEIVGSLSFLRSLCSMPDAAEWPLKMQALLEAEGTTPGRRERLAGAYNKGYRAFALTYRSCTSSANDATMRYVQEGDLLSRTLTNRYGG